MANGRATSKRDRDDAQTRSVVMRVENPDKVDAALTLMGESRGDALISAAMAIETYRDFVRCHASPSVIEKLSKVAAHQAIRDLMNIAFALSKGYMLLALETQDLRPDAEVLRANASKGGSAKLANSPVQAAKVEAERLWPLAARKGWTAERLWTALLAGGHNVKPDTVRKWLTKLRKYGTCK
jgi:hypothetical protein